MQDAFAYCAELIRQADRDRYIAALFAPADRRKALHALYAFNVEVARVREAAHQALAGEIRLQWWTDVLNGERREEASANPVAAALWATIERHALPVAKLLALVEARRFDLYDEPMAGVAALETYAVETSAGVISVAAHILAGIDAEAAATPAGIAYALSGFLRALPLHAARRQLYLPLDVLARFDIDAEYVLVGQSSPGLSAALAELRALARRHLAGAHPLVMALPRAALPAFLPVALVRPSLDRLEGLDAFAPRELSPWRRQWLIWRAAHNPARIAG